MTPGDQQVSVWVMFLWHLWASVEMGILFSIDIVHSTDDV